jgi:hypothetical protein
MGRKVEAVRRLQYRPDHWAGQCKREGRRWLVRVSNGRAILTNFQQSCWEAPEPPWPVRGLAELGCLESLPGKGRLAQPG